MTQPDARNRSATAGLFAPLSEPHAVRLVCAALALALLAAVFRIVSIW